MGAEIEDVELLEDPGVGLVWYTGSDSNLELPVLQNVSTGERFVVSPSISPMILDVLCTDTMKNVYSWSRVNGNVALRGQVAFNLNPQSGVVSGTPALDLTDTQGRASVVISCQVALGGPAYDRVLPVANVTVKILDDVCWVPSKLQNAGLWQSIQNQSQASCLRQCRLHAACGAAQQNNQTCYLMVPEGQPQKLESALVRLDNCSEGYSSLNLSVPGAWYVQGQFTPSNSYQHEAGLAKTHQKSRVFLRAQTYTDTVGVFFVLKNVRQPHGSHITQGVVLPRGLYYGTSIEPGAECFCSSEAMFGPEICQSC